MVRRGAPLLLDWKVQYLTPTRAPSQDASSKGRARRLRPHGAHRHDHGRLGSSSPPSLHSPSLNVVFLSDGIFSRSQYAVGGQLDEDELQEEVHRDMEKKKAAGGGLLKRGFEALTGKSSGPQ